jgi:uroporphyrinogen decarboxylase
LSLRTPLAQPKSLIRALLGETQAQPTFWFMRQAGRYLPEYRELRAKAGSFLQLCMNPELAAEVTLQPIHRFAMDAAILFADILLVPHAMGQKLEFKEGEGPVLAAVRDEAAIDALSDDPGEILRSLKPVFETVHRVARALPFDTALIGFAGAPWTVATYMVEGGSSRDFAIVRQLAYTQPALFQRLIDRLVDATSAYLEAQVRAGAEAIQLFDSWAGILPETEFQRWCIAPTREIVSRLRRSHPGVPVIGFPRGAGLMAELYAAETGVTTVALDQTMPLAWAAANLQPNWSLQGNLDPLLLVTGGAPMQTAARRILEAFGRGPFVFNLGHGIVPETPPEHVAQLCELIRHWRS